MSWIRYLQKVRKNNVYEGKEGKKENDAEGNKHDSCLTLGFQSFFLQGYPLAFNQKFYTDGDACR